jgi:hypothetical protein
MQELADLEPIDPEDDKSELRKISYVKGPYDF